MKTRLLNIELLRIVAMLLITLWHFHAWYIMPNIDQIDNVTSHMVGIGMNFLPFHVNAFILISGYFGIKSSNKGLVQIYTMCLFYVFLDFFLSLYLGKQFNLEKLIFPISHGRWWFINIYTLLLLIAPFINKMVEKLTKKEWLLLLISLGLIDCYFGFIQHLGTLYNYGYDLVNMTTVYIIGRFMSTEYCPNPKKSKALLAFSSIMLVKVTLQYVGRFLNIDLIFGSNDYCNPLLILAAVYFFFIFLNIKIQKSKIIPFLSKSVIGVYLLTSLSITQPYMANAYLSVYLCMNKIPFIGGALSVILFLMIIFIVIVLIDKIRLFVCSGINRWLQTKIGSFVNLIIR